MRKKYISYCIFFLLGTGILFILTGARWWQRPPAPEKQFPVNYVDITPGGKTGARLSVAGAKNEYLNLYFRVRGADPSSLKLAVKKKSAANVTYTFYQVRPIPFMATSQFYIPPDALVPLGEGLERLLPLDLLVTIKIPAPIAAGVYAHQLVFTDNQGSFTFPVQLQVWNFTLPKDLPITIMGNLWGVEKYFAPYGVNTPETFDLAINKFLSSMREYKMNALGPSTYPFDIRKITPGKKLEEEFPRYHKILSYALNDLNYRYFCLPKIPGGKKELQHKTNLIQPAKKLFPPFRDYLRRHGWESRAINKMLDEPLLPYYPTVYEIYGLSKAMAPSWRTFCSGREPDPRLAKVINIWAISARNYHQDTAASARAQGQEIWLYFNRLHMMYSPAASQRLLGWLLFRYRFSGYLFWGMNAWWVNVYGQEPLNKHLGGILYYPNPRDGSPWPTTRLEAIRLGLQDYQYLNLLEQAKARGKIDPKTFGEIQRRLKLITDGFRVGMEYRKTFGEMESLRNSIGEILNRAGP